MRLSRAGFTLLEILVASAMALVVIGAAVSAFVAQQRRASFEETKTWAKTETTELRDRIVKTFREKLFPKAGDPPSVFPVPFKTPPSTTLAAPCVDLKIARRVTPPAGPPPIIEWIGFHTECAGQCVRVKRYRADGVTLIETLATYPRIPNMTFTAVCLRDQGNHVTGNITASVTLGRDFQPITLPLIMPKQEASSGVELIPN